MVKFRNRVLEEEYTDYIKHNKLTGREKKALRQWVATGHSVYQNPDNCVDEYFNEEDYITNMRRSNEDYEIECVWSPYEHDLVCVRRKAEKNIEECNMEECNMEEDLPF